MQTSLETLGQLERRLTMSVPVAEIETEIDKRLARLAKDVKMPGFRPGKVPMKMVAQQYGPQVRSDVITDARAGDVRRRGARAEPARRRLSRASSPERGDGVRRARVHRRLRGLSRSEARRPLRVTIERPVAEVGDADVDETIEMLRKQRTHYDRVERAAPRRRSRDRRFAGRIDGVEFAGGQASDFAIVIGEGGCCRSSRPRSPA